MSCKRVMPSHFPARASVRWAIRMCAFRLDAWPWNTELSELAREPFWCVQSMNKAPIGSLIRDEASSIERRDEDEIPRRRDTKAVDGNP